MVESALNDSAQSPESKSSAPAPAPRAPKPRRRWLRRIGWLLLSLVLIVVAALGAAWWWSGRDDSLADTLQRVARFLPEGQTLEARGVTQRQLDSSVKPWSTPEEMAAVFGGSVAR